MIPNRGIVGDTAYHLESGMVVEEYYNIGKKASRDLANVGLFPVHHSFVGNEEPKIVLGKLSGRGNVLAWAEKLGIALRNEEIPIS